MPSGGTKANAGLLLLMAFIMVFEPAKAIVSVTDFILHAGFAKMVGTECFKTVESCENVKGECQEDFTPAEAKCFFGDIAVNIEYDEDELDLITSIRNSGLIGRWKEDSRRDEIVDFFCRKFDQEKYK